MLQLSKWTLLEIDTDPRRFWDTKKNGGTLDEEAQGRRAEQIIGKSMQVKGNGLLKGLNFENFRLSVNSEMRPELCRCLQSSAEFPPLQRGTPLVSLTKEELPRGKN